MTDEVFSDSKALVFAFVKDKLGGKLDGLVTYNFLELYRNKDKTYGGVAIEKNVESEFSPDQTKLANAIYYILWHEFIGKRYLLIDDSNDPSWYSGDALNTYKTLFGSYDKDDEKNHFDKIPSSLKSDKGFMDKVKHFHEAVCFTLGNFSFLPKHGKTKNDKCSINVYRGNFLKWRDYYDIFLDELAKVFSDAKDKDATLCDLVVANDFYFDLFKVDGEFSIEKFKAVNFLEPYYDKGNVDLKYIKAQPAAKRNFDEKTPPDCYKDFAEHYINFCESTIEYRGKKMLEALRRELEL